MSDSLPHLYVRAATPTMAATLSAALKAELRDATDILPPGQPHEWVRISMLGHTSASEQIWTHCNEIVFAGEEALENAGRFLLTGQMPENLDKLLDKQPPAIRLHCAVFNEFMGPKDVIISGPLASVTGKDFIKRPKSYLYEEVTDSSRGDFSKTQEKIVKDFCSEVLRCPHVVSIYIDTSIQPGERPFECAPIPPSTTPISARPSLPPLPLSTRPRPGSSLQPGNKG